MRTLDRLVEYLGEAAYSSSVTVVADGCTDSTVRLVRDCMRRSDRIALIEYQPNRGKGHAVRRGMLEVDGQYLLLCDADLATPIEEVEKLIPPISSGLAIAIGSRPLRESRLEVRQPWHREMLGRAFNKVVQMLAVRGIHDTQCGFKLFRQDAARDVFRRCKLDGFSFDFEALMIARDLGYGIAEIPIRWRHQEGSKVKLLRDGTRMVIDLVRLRLMGKRGRLEPRAD